MLGQLVLYALSDGDVEAIDAGCPVMLNGRTVRNGVRVGQQLPAVVTADFGGSQNLRVLLDGYGGYWATSRARGSRPGTWSTAVHVGAGG